MFTKIPTRGVLALSHAGRERETDRQKGKNDEASSIFRSFANAPKTYPKIFGNNRMFTVN